MGDLTVKQVIEAMGMRSYDNGWNYTKIYPDGKVSLAADYGIKESISLASFKELIHEIIGQNDTNTPETKESASKALKMPNKVDADTIDLMVKAFGKEETISFLTLFVFFLKMNIRTPNYNEFIELSENIESCKTLIYKLKNS